MHKFASFISQIWAANRTILLRLVFPLLILASVSLSLSKPLTTRDIFLNLTTDFITIVITVLYVDWVLKESDRRRWERADKFITAEAGKLGHGFISNVAEALDIERELFPHVDFKTMAEIQAQVIEGTRALTREQLEDSLKVLASAQWIALIDRLQANIRQTSDFLNQFGQRLDPAKLESILEFREIVAGIVSTHALFRRFLGVPVDKLPKVKDGKPWEITIISIIRIAIDLKKALDGALRIISIFSYRPEEPPNLDKEMKQSWERWYRNQAAGRQEVDAR